MEQVHTHRIMRFWGGSQQRQTCSSLINNSFAKNIERLHTFIWHKASLPQKCFEVIPKELYVEIILAKWGKKSISFLRNRGASRNLISYSALRSFLKNPRLLSIPTWFFQHGLSLTQLIMVPRGLISCLSCKFSVSLQHYYGGKRKVENSPMMINRHWRCSEEHPYGNQHMMFHCGFPVAIQESIWSGCHNLQVLWFVTNHSDNQADILACCKSQR